jgi:hypothetical protein
MADVPQRTQQSIKQGKKHKKCNKCRLKIKVFQMFITIALLFHKTQLILKVNAKILLKHEHTRNPRKWFYITVLPCIMSKFLNLNVKCLLLS